MIAEGVSTVALGVPDNAGRLIGKRLSVSLWERVQAKGTLAMPDFHLITGLENRPLPGLEAAGAHSGFSNGLLRPDMGTARALPWDAGTMLVLCDALTSDGTVADVAPRSILRNQVRRLAEHGLTSSCASELEFHLFKTSYEQAFRQGYRALEPAYHRHGDNDLLVEGHLEHLLGEIRRSMPLAGIPVELSQGEGGIGQFEVTLEHAPPVEMADRHVIYKHGVKQLAQRHGLAASFMAKVSATEAGSSCHVHMSLRRQDGSPALGPGEDLGAVGNAFLAGLLRYTPELCLLHAPYANSYRRLQRNSWAPTNATWGYDNRTCMVRVCGDETSRRFEFRLPGADANPYLAFAGVLAAGLQGLDDGLEPPPPVIGDAYRVDAPPVPLDITEAITRFESSQTAVRAFGERVHQHMLGLAAHERDVWRREVTDCDFARGFEAA